MTNHHRLSAVALAASTVAAVSAMAGPALSQASATQRNLVLLGKSATTVVMASDLPSAPATGQHDIWVWHFNGRDHERSTAAGAFGRAVRITIDCSDRTAIHRTADQYTGLEFVDNVNVGRVAAWSRPGPNTLGELPIKAACDAPPATPRPSFADLAAARAYADLRLKPPPAN